GDTGVVSQPVTLSGGFFAPFLWEMAARRWYSAWPNRLCSVNRRALGMRRLSSLLICACWVVVLASLGLRAGHPDGQSQTPAPASTAGAARGAARSEAPSEAALVKQYCVTCHNARTQSGGLSLEGLDPAAAASHADVWEKVTMKLRGGMMP